MGAASREEVEKKPSGPEYSSNAAFPRKLAATDDSTGYVVPEFRVDGDGWFNDGLMKLGRYDIGLQRRLETHLVGRNSQFFANGALNVRLLSQRQSP